MNTKNIQLNGRNLRLITLSNHHMKVSVLSLGASLIHLETPDKDGVFEPIVLSYESFDDYLPNPKLLGSTVAPYAGRIAPPKLPLNGVKTLLESKEDTVFLHSEKANVAHQEFRIDSISTNHVTLIYTHPDGFAGYPGNIELKVTYQLDRDRLAIHFESTSDAMTYVNPTHHSYFNLSGHLKTDISNHHLKIPSKTFYQLDDFGVPTHPIEVTGTPFDFQKLTPLKTALKELKNSNTKGIDHPYVVSPLGLITLYEPQSGRKMEMQSTYDGLVVYTNNQVSTHTFMPNVKDRRYLGICLEAQHIPNDVHRDTEPRSKLASFKTRKHSIWYRFSCDASNG